MKLDALGGHAQAGIRVAIAWGYLSEEQSASALAAIDHLGGRVFGLSRRSGSGKAQAARSARFSAGLYCRPRSILLKLGA